MDSEGEAEETYVMQLEQPCSEVGIEVVEGINRGHGISSYVGYIIKVSHPTKLTVERRYRQFDALRDVLMNRWPGVMIPCLPRKHSSGSNSIKVVKERVKYLTHFLNCCSKLNYIFMSDQFQLFLTSVNSDLKTFFQKIPRITNEQKLRRYRAAFPQIQINESKKYEISTFIKDIIDPFMKKIQEKRITLINIKKEIYKLAVKRQQYVKNKGILYKESLPQFQNYIQQTTDKCQLVLHSNIQLKQKTDQITLDKMQLYWLLYESLRLQIGQSQATVQALQRRIETQRQQQRISKTILSNDDEINNIRSKKLTLRQFFNGNKQELIRQLEQQNLFLHRELQSISILTFYVNQIVLKYLIGEFNVKRQKIWKNVWNKFITRQMEHNKLMIDFYTTVKSSIS